MRGEREQRGGVPHQPAASRERSLPREGFAWTEANGWREGDFTAFTEHFVHGYCARLPELTPGIEVRDRELAQAITAVVRPIAEADRGRTRIFGSMARFMADEVPHDFWDVWFHIHGQRTDPAVPQEVREVLFGSSLGFGDPDLDITTGIYTRHAFKVLVDRFGASAGTSVAVSGDSERQEMKAALSDRFFFTASEGPIPTVPSIRNIVIGIHDAATGARVFHVDISREPLTGSEILTERRQGLTNLRQDAVTVLLEPAAHGRMRVHVSPESIDAMRNPDVLRTESDDPDVLMEEILRAIRMNLWHVRDTDFDLNKLSPLFTDESIWQFRYKVFQRVIHDNATLSPSLLPYLGRELYLCDTIDPYLTRQALFDTGAYLFLPGLRDFTGEDVDSYLHDRRFVVTAAGQKNGTITDETIREEWYAYRHGDRSTGRNRLFNGPEMVMTALYRYHTTRMFGSNPIDPYGEYFRYQFGDMSADTKPDSMLFTGLPADKTFMRLRPGVFIQVPEGTQASDAMRTVILRELLTDLLLHSAKQNSLDAEGRNKLHERMRKRGYRLVSHLFLIGNPDVSTEGMEQANVRAEWVESLTYVYRIMRLLPAGITAKHLSDLYKDEAKARIWRIHNQLGGPETVPLVDEFSQVLLAFKMFGFANKRSLMKDSFRHGTQPTDMYSLRRLFSETDILPLFNNPDFIRAYMETVGADPDSNEERLRWLFSVKRIAHDMADVGLGTIEILQSLSREDLQLLDKRAREYGYHSGNGQVLWTSDPDLAYADVAAIVRAFREYVRHR